LQILNALGYPVAVSVRSNHSHIRGNLNRRFNRTITAHGTRSELHSFGPHQRYSKSVGSIDKISERQ